MMLPLIRTMFAGLVLIGCTPQPLISTPAPAQKMDAKYARSLIEFRSESAMLFLSARQFGTDTVVCGAYRYLGSPEIEKAVFRPVLATAIVSVDGRRILEDLTYFPTVAHTDDFLNGHIGQEAACRGTNTPWRAEFENAKISVTMDLRTLHN